MLTLKFYRQESNVYYTAYGLEISTKGMEGFESYIKQNPQDGVIALISFADDDSGGVESIPLSKGEALYVVDSNGKTVESVTESSVFLNNIKAAK